MRRSKFIHDTLLNNILFNPLVSGKNQVFSSQKFKSSHTFTGVQVRAILQVLGLDLDLDLDFVMESEVTQPVTWVWLESDSG